MKILLLLAVLLCTAGCGTAKNSAPPPPAPTSGIRKSIDDAVDATLTHKSQIRAFQKAKKRLGALDAKNRQMIQELEGNDGE